MCGQSLSRIKSSHVSFGASILMPVVVVIIIIIVVLPPLEDPVVIRMWTSAKILTPSLKSS